MDQTSVEIESVRAVWRGVPILGKIIPNMGKKKYTLRRRPAAGLADALFSRTQQGVLGLLFGQPHRSFYASELIGLVGAGSGTVQRELARLEESGLVTVRRLGSQKHYQANVESPLFNELHGIVVKTVGLAEPVRAALAPLHDDITAAFIFGSVAKQKDTSTSDIDLMVISDDLAYADLFAALEPMQGKLGRAINPTVYTRQEWVRRRKKGNSFVERVLGQPKVWIIGGDRELAA
jgi:predicted nucleotidyltransferase